MIQNGLGRSDGNKKQVQSVLRAILQTVTSRIRQRFSEIQCCYVWQFLIDGKQMRRTKYFFRYLCMTIISSCLKFHNQKHRYCYRGLDTWWHQDLTSAKETELPLYKVKSHYYTHRTASVDPTVSQMEGNLWNNTWKVTCKLTPTCRI